MHDMDLIFRRFGESELEQFITWFADPELSRRISFPTRQWFDYVQTPGNYAWMIFENDTPVGYVQFGLEGDNRASFALAVKPDLRSRGYCKRIVQALMKRPEAEGLACIEGYVEVDNMPSQRCIVSAGFRQVSETPDEDGMFKFEYSFSEVVK